MSEQAQFEINNSLKHYLSNPASTPTPEADERLQELENGEEQLSSAVANQILNPIVERLASNPDSLNDPSIFDTLQAFLKFSPLVPSSAVSKILDVLTSATTAEADLFDNDAELEDTVTTQGHKRLLEMYAFLLQWSLACVEAKTLEKPSDGAPQAKGRGKAAGKAKASTKDASWDAAKQIQDALAAMSRVTHAKLAKAFITTSEKDTFVSLFTRPVYLLFENEQRVKDTSIRMHGFKVLCLAIKHHGHAHAAQISIMQNLSYFEHLSEPMAELLHILAGQFDHTQLCDEVLRDISAKSFNENDTKGPKSIATFLTKLSELAPRSIMKQMTLLIRLLDSESYTLRCAIIEVCGNLIADLSKQEDRDDTSKKQINGFFEILEQRFLDINPYARCRVLQVCVRLCDLDQKFPKRRQTMAQLAVQCLEDKSSNVRRNAIKLLTKLTTSHPFGLMHGSQLSQVQWQARLEAVDAQLDAIKPPAGSPGLARKNRPAYDEADKELLDDKTVLEGEEEQPTESPEEQIAKAAEDAATADMLNKLQLTKKYYSEALKFMEALHHASLLVGQLLSSKNKSEVIEAMDFFVIMDAYKLDGAKSGIRRMLKLIWTKDNSDEGKGVQTHLLECYKGLFFVAPENLDENDAANFIARNMISLTFGATSADLTSLEQLLSTMMTGGHISDLVISKLWQVYGARQEISRTQRRGAIAVLGMLASAAPQIVADEMETALGVGLGPLGRADLDLARYTCIALKRLSPDRRHAKEAKTQFKRLENSEPVLQRLAGIALLESGNKLWYGVGEQAINAIYALARQPDVLCGAILKQKTRAIFAMEDQAEPKQESADADAMDIDEDASTTPKPQPAPKSRPSNSLLLAQLMFLVGHIAIKQIVHLELCEQDFKRKKAEKEKSKAEEPKSKDAQEAADELDLIGGTTEDDFTEAMANIREHELLFGENALLKPYAAMVSEVCAKNDIYTDKGLQSAATLCLAKLMCVSSRYCEQNLPLLITIMEKSGDAVTRSNAVVALGDMAVCFNHLIDENTDFLYRRLNDKDDSVKRTCLMTLTFLILAGQVKVKGQLGEMAKCLEDNDKRIADLAKMFFTELSTKDNAVYNQFVDMFSILTADQTLEEDSLRRIVKFLAGFIGKDKHAKQLAEKLAARLARCETEKQWNDTAYAISLLQHKNEEITKTVAGGFRTVQVAA